MKKIAILLSAVALGAVSAMAQGNFVFANNSTFPIKISDPNINGGAAVVVGTAANTAGFVGAGPGQVTGELFVAPNGTSLAALEAGTPVGTTHNFNSIAATAQGAFNGGNPFVLPAPYNGSAPIEYIFYAFTTGNTYTGWSTEGVNYTPTTGTTLPTATFGNGAGQISGWTLSPVPEPTTLALGGLGAAALLLFRRRKN